MISLNIVEDIFLNGIPLNSVRGIPLNPLEGMFLNILKEIPLNKYSGNDFSRESGEPVETIILNYLDRELSGGEYLKAS